MKRFPILLCVAILFAQVTYAATYTGTLSVESNSDVSDTNAGLYTYLNRVSVASLPDFDFPFSTLGDTDFSITWQAPTNYRIQITPPSGFDSVQVIFQFYTGDVGYNVGQISPVATLSVTDFSGNTLPVLNPATQFTGPATTPLPATNAGAFIFPTGYALDEPFYLSSATVEFTVPDAYDVDFNAPLLGFEVFGSAFSNQPSTVPPNPGQWITLVAVPEPSSAVSLLGLGVVGFARRRRLPSVADKAS